MCVKYYETDGTVIYGLVLT